MLFIYAPNMFKSQLDELECMEKCDPNALVAELIHNKQKIRTNYELYYTNVYVIYINKPRYC